MRSANCTLVSESARQPEGHRRAATLHRIVVAAQELAIERGYPDFTLADLAERAEVSRRTLFNYVDGKERAVLGPMPALDADQLLTFSAGGPTGNLIRDLVELLIATLTTADTQVADLRRFQQVILRNPALLGTVQQDVEALATQACDHAAARPGETPERARLAIAVVLSLFHTSAEHSVTTNDGRSIADHLREQVIVLTDLFS